ncbi:unnamed protein product, partial [Staurois parvus]
MWGDQRVNSVLCVFYCVSTLLCIALLCSGAMQCAGADRGEICIVYIQTSPLSVILGNRRVPVGN